MLTYNHERYISDAIEGVLAQQATFPIELLIGEDCSTDSTRRVALGYQTCHPDVIQVITSDTNVGMHENFRRLFQASRGQFIALCEGDDFWTDPCKLQTQVDLIRDRPDVTAIFTDFVVADFRHAGWIVDPRSRVFGGLSVTALRGDLRRTPLDGRLRTLTALYRSAIVSAMYERCLPIQAFSFIDHFLLAQAISSGNIERLDRVTAVYRRSPGSATRSNPTDSLRFLQSLRRFSAELHLMFPALAPRAAEDLAEVDIMVCRAAYLAGDSDAFNEAYSVLKSCGAPIPKYLRILRRLVGHEFVRRASVHLRSSGRRLTKALRQ